MANKFLNKMVKSNGYDHVLELLLDYGFIPTRTMRPNYKKREIIKLILNSIFSNNKSG